MLSCLNLTSTWLTEIKVPYTDRWQIQEVNVWTSQKQFMLVSSKHLFLRSPHRKTCVCDGQEYTIFSLSLVASPPVLIYFTSKSINISDVASNR